MNQKTPFTRNLVSSHIQVDPSVSPPPLRPIAPEMKTPYPSRASLFFKDKEEPHTLLTSGYDIYHDILIVPDSPYPSCGMSPSEGGVEIEPACSAPLETEAGVEQCAREQRSSDNNFKFEALSGTQRAGASGDSESAGRVRHADDEGEEGELEGRRGGEENGDENAEMGGRFQFHGIHTSSCDTQESQCLQFHTSSSGYVTDTHSSPHPFSPSLLQVEHTFQYPNEPTLASREIQISSCANGNVLKPLSDDHELLTTVSSLQGESSTDGSTQHVCSHQKLPAEASNPLHTCGFHNSPIGVESICSDQQFDRVSFLVHCEAPLPQPPPQLTHDNCIQNTQQEFELQSALDSSTSGGTSYIQDYASYNQSSGTTRTSMTSLDTSSDAYFTSDKTV